MHSGPDREMAPFFDCTAADVATHIAPEALAAGQQGEYPVAPRQDSFSVGVLMLLAASPRLPWHDRAAADVREMMRTGTVAAAFAGCITAAPAAYINIALWLCDRDPAARMLCVRAHGMLTRLHASALAGEELSIDDLAAQYNCHRHRLLPQFRVEGAALPAPQPRDSAGPVAHVPCSDGAADVLDIAADSPTVSPKGASHGAVPAEPVAEVSAGSTFAFVSGSSGDFSQMLLPWPPPAPLLPARSGEEACDVAARCLQETTSSAPSAEIPAVGGGASYVLPAVAEPVQMKCPVMEVLVEERSCSADSPQEVRGGWVKRMRVKCEVALKRAFVCSAGSATGPGPHKRRCQAVDGYTLCKDAELAC